MDHSDNSIIKAGKNTENILEDLGRFVIAQTPVKNERWCEKLSKSNYNKNNDRPDFIIIIKKREFAKSLMLLSRLNRE